jgi:hypothetical protein
MERCNFLKLTIGFVAGGMMLAATAQAAPVPPISIVKTPVTAGASVEPAVVSQNDVDNIKPEQVRWHRGGHHHWHHRGWHHRHWGWRHHHWHRHHWRHHRHW